MTAQTPRTRLSPEARTAQLLDTAKSMIELEGLQNFTMESLARTAGVSSPLVYNYFPSRQALLEELLRREHASFTKQLSHDVANAEEFEEIVRLFVCSNFDHHAPGNILPILQSQPEIAIAIEPQQRELGKQVANFLVKSAATRYKLSRPQAALAVSMSSGASIAAAELAAKTGRDRAKSIDAALAYILAGIEQIAQKDN